MTPLQGEIWWAEAADKRRPVLVVTRSEAISVLGSVLVAPVTRSIRSIPSEVRLGPDDGLSVECVASFDNLQSLPKAMLTARIGSIGRRRFELCRALSALADC